MNEDLFNIKIIVLNSTT